MSYGRLCLAAGIALAVSTASFAQGYDGDPSAPEIVYGTAPVVIAVPPTGYLLDPSDMRKPIYMVNQGPDYSGPGIYYSGPGIYAVQTYSEGGYAYVEPYPYIWSYGHGPYSIFRAARPHGYRNYREGRRPYGYLPYDAYRYQPAPSARIIQVPPRSEWTSLR
jgi:hypothetical protein